MDKARRRGKAREFKPIPGGAEAADLVRLRLAKMERENTFRLKRIKG